MWRYDGTMKQIKTFEEIFASISGGRILDVATGNGNFIQAVIGTFKDYAEIMAVDTSERFAPAFAQAFDGKPVKFMQMDAAKLEFPDASFDTVCISNSMHHMADLPAVLDEMKRVLKPGGRFIISEMYRDGQSEPQMTHVNLHHWWGAVDTAQGVCHNETYTRQEMLTIAEGIGLSGWEFHDVAYLDDDPKGPEILQQLNSVIDQYIQKAQGLPSQEAQQARGEELRQRVSEVGFHGATALVAIGEK